MSPMGTSSTGSARTAPKGRATRARSDGRATRGRLSSTVQWIIVIVVALAVAGTIMYLARDVRTNTGTLAPSDPVAPAVVSAPS